jgi:FkbM family methyltransferase
VYPLVLFPPRKLKKEIASVRIRHTKRRKTYVHALGLRGLWFHLRELLGDKRTVSFHFPGIHGPIFIRLNSTDLDVLNAALVKKEYALEIRGEPKVIVDAGANIGLTTLYFARMYPQAKIYAIEPESENFILLQKNTRLYPNIVCIRAALWNQNGSVKLYDRHTGQWGFSVFGDNESHGHFINEIQGMTFAGFMKQYNIEHVDILKMDIEGSEKEVFTESGSWIDHVGVIAVELHERIKGGCRRAFYNATSRFEHELSCGEKLIFVIRDRYWREQTQGRKTGSFI